MSVVLSRLINFTSATFLNDIFILTTITFGVMVTCYQLTLGVPEILDFVNWGVVGLTCRVPCFKRFALNWDWAVFEMIMTSQFMFTFSGSSSQETSFQWFQCEWSKQRERSQRRSHHREHASSRKRRLFGNIFRY